MAEHIKAMKQKNGSSYNDLIPLGADAQYVDLQVQVRNQNGDTQNEKNLQEIMGIYKKQSPIANIIEQHFYGTLDEWNALTTEQKKEYDIVDILETYTIHYDSNGGSGTMSDDTKLLGQPYTIKSSEFIPPNDFIDPQYTVNGGYRYKKYYTFAYKEWNTDEDGYEKIYHSGDAYTKDANLTLYAQWEKAEDTSKKVNEQYYVTINTDDGVESVTIDGYNEPWVNKGDTIHLNIVTKPGYLILNGDEDIEDIQHAETVNITTICGVKFSSDEPFELSVETPNWEGTIEYYNNNTWVEWDGSELSGTANQPIYLRGLNNNRIAGQEDEFWYIWTFTGKYVTGNIETLLDYQTVVSGRHPEMTDYCYAGMFKGCTSLISAPELPAEELSEHCYESMFYGCTALTDAPILPAEDLAWGCYESMFNGCISLTEAPILPAEELVRQCYYDMFNGCTLLTTAPELLATELADGCYNGMFAGCTALRFAPVLPATQLEPSCYYGMFEGCSSLIAAPELPATNLASACYQEMFKDCENITSSPALPAEELAVNCYRDMFNNSGVYILPELLAITLVDNCYSGMFKNCTALKVSTDSDAEYQYSLMIPASGGGTATASSLTDMFAFTGGSFKDTPAINTTYYTTYPVGSANNYISYNANGGDGDTILDIKSYNESINIRSNTFTHDDYDEEIEEDGYKYTNHHVYTFNSWNTEADGSGIQYDPNDTYNINENLTLYAIWNDSITVIDEYYYLTVNKNNGVQTATPSQWVIKGNSVNVTATAKDGWLIDSGTGSVIMDSAKTINIISIPVLKFSSDGPFILSVATKGWDGTLQYSTNSGSSWSTWNGSELSGTASQPIYLRGTGNSIITGTSNSANKWTFTGKYCTGNIETLLDYQTVANGQHPTMGSRCYAYMFYDCTALTTAPSLPATTLATYCYYNMFYGCTALTTAPSLPATALTNYCYGYMFYGCTTLTTAPSLPATALTNYCYAYMFYGCTTLTTAPSLPATTLAEGCYHSMFRVCTSLTTAPQLPATTLVTYCYMDMFDGCTKLKVREGGSGTKIFTCPSTIPNNAVSNMFRSTGGTFTGTPTAGNTYYYY